ncbi:dephospho-CoA kinase [Solimonas fluminis]|uniref:Dephospho-CoA kinase n=1 Tax=Solimonas fluminis TaxID=2086571 RepID=A0A2S5TI53_9GAMM|nr:dephospho-CoA kinase [Solimonas fluminis]PPE74663.1 dephospho-CoA kinase [Solimonas fluminis]
MPRLTVGLTGGIASGKSLIADYFMELGVPVLDADQVARDVVAPGAPALLEIARTFGRQYLAPDGQLDRRKMRERVFTEPEARKTLEDITHPHIRKRMTQWRDAQASAYCILSVAILVESGMRELVDRVLVVDVAPETQLARLQDRDRINEDLAQRMLQAQASRRERLAAAHDVIANTGSMAAAKAAVEELHAYYLSIARTGEIYARGLSLPRTVI